ncbi:hypothetical protein HNO89_003683 [Sporosarcina luteola]|nr:hypothetical protein [Sporosarcina luteola]
MRIQAIVSGVVFSSILLAGCNGNEIEEHIQVIESEQGAVENEQGNLLSEVKDKIIASITEQTAIEADAIAIMLGGGAGKIDVSVGFPKDVKVDDRLIQHIVEDSIKKVAETENIIISEEDISIKIEEY